MALELCALGPCQAGRVTARRGPSASPKPPAGSLPQRLSRRIVPGPSLALIPGPPMPSCLGLGRMRLAWVLMAMTVGVGGDLHLHAIQKGPTSCTSALEPLMQQHSAEKSKSGHKYTDLYAALFDAVRDGVANVTVLGATGPQLRQAWQAYFCNAAVHVVDPEKVLEPDAAAPPVRRGKGRRGGARARWCVRPMRSALPLTPQTPTPRPFGRSRGAGLRLKGEVPPPALLA